MKNSRQIFLYILLFIAPSCVASTEAPRLTAQLTQFLTNQQAELAAKGFRSEFIIGNIDPRFNEKACQQPIDFSLNRSPLNQANLTALATCNDEKPWKLYISLTFNVFGEVVYAANTLPRGHAIQASDLEIKEEIINKHYYASFSQKSDVVGMLTKRSIRQGSSIQANLLQAPKLIKRGDDVVIVASTQSILIKMRGTALEDGELGEQITVKNNQSAKVIKAKVSESGLVSVTL